MHVLYHSAMSIFQIHFVHSQDFPVAQTVKKLSAVQETWILSLGQEDPLQRWVATHSSILAWRIPWTEDSGRLRSTGSQRVGHHWPTNTFTSRLLQKGRPAGEDRTKKAGGQGFFLFFSTLAKGWLENSLRDGNTRPPYLPPEKSVCSSRSII